MIINYTFCRLKTFRIFSFFVYFIFSGTLLAQCPVVLNPNQIFCDSQSPAVINLQATDTGGGIKWYESLISTVPLANDLVLENNKDYFVDDNTGTCGLRKKVVVTVYSKPIGDNFQGACVIDVNDALITNPQINVVGDNLKWYTSNTSLNPILASTILSDESIYYISQTNPITNCESLRLQVKVSVGLVPVPTGNAIQEFCLLVPGNPPRVSDLEASGLNNWYMTSDFGFPIDVNTPLVDGQFYYATTIDPPCESAKRLEVQAKLYERKNPGISAQQDICISDVATTVPFDLFNLLGGTPDKVGAWSGPLSTLNGYQGTVDISSLTVAGSPYVFTYTVSSPQCPVYTSTVTINILPLPTVLVNSPVVCDGTLATVEAIASPAGDYNFVWTVPSGVTNPGNVSSFDTTIEGTYSVIATSLSTTCNSASASGTVTINLIPTVTVSSPPVCLGETATLTATPNPSGSYDYVWTVPSGVINPGNVASFDTTTAGDYSVVITNTITTCPSLPGQGTVIINLIPTVTVSSPPVCLGTPATVTAIPNPAGNYDYTWTVPSGVTNPGNVPSFDTTTAGDYSVVITNTSTTCPSLPSQGTVIINSIPTVTVSSTPVCFGTSTTVTATPSPAGNYDYVWTVPSGVTNPGNVSSFDTTIAGDYGVVITNTATACPSLPTQGTVIINLIPTVTVSSPPVCLGETATVTAIPNPSGSYDYVWTVPSGVTNPGNVASFDTTTTGDYSVVITNTVSACPSLPSQGSVVINDLPIVTISSDATICSGEEVQVVFTGTPNATVTYTINGGINRTIVLDGTGQNSIVNSYTSTTIFTLVSVSSSGVTICSQLQTGSMSIIVAPLPFVSLSSDVSVCPDEQTTITFTGTPNATVTYNINAGTNQTIDLDSSGIGLLTNSYSSTTVISLVSIKTQGSPGCIAALTGEVKITIFPLPFATISANSNVCAESNAIIKIKGTPNATVVYTINGGSNLTILLNGIGEAEISSILTVNSTYALVSVTSSTSSCNSLLTDSVTININPLPTVSISSNGTVCSGSNGTVTFTGTPNTQVTYTINGGSNQYITIDDTGIAVLNPALVVTTVFNLVNVSLLDPPSCSTPITGSTIIEVAQPPKAGINTDLLICSEGNPKDLFELLGPTADSGGTWSPELSSGTGLFNPSIDLPIAYTYTVAGTPPCVNATSLVVVSIVPSVNAGTDGIATLCTNADAVDLITFLGNSAQAGGVWTPALKSNSGVFDPSVDSPGNYTYTINGVAPCNNSSATVSVTILQGPDAGVSGTAILCLNNPSQDLFLSLGGTPQAGGSWSPNLTSGTGFFDPAVDLAGVYTYTLTGANPCGDDTATVNVIVNPVPNAGDDATATICSNITPTDLITYLEGSPQAGGTWSPQLASGTGVFDPSVDLEGNYTYSVGDPFCVPDSAVLTVKIIEGPDAGISGNALFCINDSPKNLFLSLGGTPQVGGIWSPSMASGTGVFNPAVDVAGVYTYVLSANLPCNEDVSTVTVTVDPVPNAGTFVGKQSVCNSSVNFDLFTLLTGYQTGGVWKDNLNKTVNNIVNVSNFIANTYSYTYTVLNSCSSDSEVVQLEILPSPILSAANVVISSPNCKGDNVNVVFSNMVNGTYSINYNLSLSNVLSNQNAIVTIVDGSAVYSIDASIIPNIGTTRVTFLNITNTVSNCSTAIIPNVSADFILRPTPNLENSNLVVANVCIGNDVKVLISGANAGLTDGNYQFNYKIPLASPTTGTTGTIIISGGSGQFTVPAAYFNTPGEYAITITSIRNLSSSCNNLNKEVTTTFKINSLPNILGATIATGVACMNYSNEVIVTGATNLIDGMYTIGYQLTGANNVTALAPISFVNGIGSFIIPGDKLIFPGTVTLKIVEINSIITQCGSITNTINSVNFLVNQIDSPTLDDKGFEFCGYDNPTLANLSANITNSSGGLNIVWYKNQIDNQMYANSDLLINGTTYYGALQLTTGCESLTRLAVTVNLDVCEDIIIPDGFSPNDDGTNDQFTIKHLRDKYPNFKLDIYNRYGNILFKGNINKSDWNGVTSEGGIKFGESKNPVGVYFYILEFNNGVKKPIQGRLYLSR